MLDSILIMSGIKQSVCLAWLCLHSTLNQPCSQECADLSRLHAAECETLARCRFKPKMRRGPDGEVEANPIYEMLTPLRCVLAKRFAPENWKVVAAMEQHGDLRRKEPLYEVNQTNTVKFILDHILNGGEEEEEDNNDNNKDNNKDNNEDNNAVTSDDINVAIDVLDVNAFEIRGEGFSARGVYPLTAMMNAVCSPNTQNCIAEDLGRNSNQS